jgi:hypothetical protein
MNSEGRMQRDSNLIATIRQKLPEFAKACLDESELVLLHQDAFAADYKEDDCLLLGMAIKYAGQRGKEVRVIGKNRSSVEDALHFRCIEEPDCTRIGPKISLLTDSMLLKT